MAERPVAIVTGGSRGIGGAISKELASLGYDVMVNHYDFGPDGKPDDSKAQEKKAELESLGAACQIFRADIGSPEERGELVALTRKEFGRCNMLVNNAGTAPSKRLDILEGTEESFDRVIGINLKGPYFLTQLVANWMVEQRKGDPQAPFRIVNTGSISSYTSSPSRGEYCISKAGVHMMTLLYADRLAEYGIGVFEVSPGIIQTDMTAAVKDKYDRLIGDGLTPIKRWGQPEDVAGVVGAIAEGRLDFSTGTAVDVDGGFHIRRL